jgi:hypothetical protein
MFEVSWLRKIRKILIHPRALSALVEASRTSNLLAIASEFRYEVLPFRWSGSPREKIAECLEVVRNKPARIDRIG